MAAMTTAMLMTTMAAAMMAAVVVVATVATQERRWDCRGMLQQGGAREWRSGDTQNPGEKVGSPIRTPTKSPGSSSCWHALLVWTIGRCCTRLVEASWMSWSNMLVRKAGFFFFESATEKETLATTHPKWWLGEKARVPTPGPQAACAETVASVHTRCAPSQCTTVSYALCFHELSKV